ncbi:nucleolin-like [Leptopilina heterotoma]|uniref:nucleolin-like n=1 Tax=Leptopilina heterotoma TaxID=63436 RepID=UPI001CA99D0F|nr:nucleolin-like [Leptopilina heterotoma]
MSDSLVAFYRRDSRMKSRATPVMLRHRIFYKSSVPPLHYKHMRECPFKDQAPQHPTVGARDQTESTTTALDGVTARPNKAKGVNKRPREGASPDASPQRATQSGKRIKRKDAPQLGSESLDGTKEAPLNSPGSSYAETVLKDGADNGDGFKVVKSKKKRTPKEKPSGEKKELPKPPLKLRSTEAVKITASDPKLYEDALSSALHGKAEVTPLVNKRSLEIKDLDEATSEDEVTAALREKLGKPDLKMECRLLPRYRGTKVALRGRDPRQEDDDDDEIEEVKKRQKEEEEEEEEEEEAYTAKPVRG